MTVYDWIKQNQTLLPALTAAGVCSNTVKHYKAYFETYKAFLKEGHNKTTAQTLAADQEGVATFTIWRARMLMQTEIPE